MLLSAEATTVLFSASSPIFSVNMISNNSWTAALSLIKCCKNMYLDNLFNPVECWGHRSKVKVTWGFVCFLCAWYCLKRLAWIHEMSFARWRHFITARGRDCGYPREVLSFEQGLTILFLTVVVKSVQLSRVYYKLDDLPWLYNERTTVLSFD